MTEPNKLPDPFRGERTALDAVFSFLRSIPPEALDVSTAMRIGGWQMLEVLNPMFAKALEEEAAGLPSGLSAADGFRHAVGSLMSALYMDRVMDVEAQDLHQTDWLTVRSIMGDNLT